MTPEGGFSREDQRRGRRSRELYKSTSGRWRSDVVNVQKQSSWSRRTQQHPFVAGGDFSLRRAKSRKQRSQRGCAGGNNARGGVHFHLGSYWGEKTSEEAKKVSTSGERLAHGYLLDTETEASSRQEMVESSDRMVHATENEGEGDGWDKTWLRERDLTSEKDSLMYSLEGRSCPPAPRHEPPYLREGACSFRDWGASALEEEAQPQNNIPASHLKSPLRRIDRQLEDFRRIIVIPSKNIPPRIRKKLDHQDSMIDSLEADNYTLREKLMELAGKLSVTATCPMSPSIAEAFPIDGYSHSKERVL
ncbi:hypothetical protein BSKO_10698 [Bryopsis sp. KO-2023]|nr:hypothetical protein BSKO_10698 [Bryopsis sp. KO-2023]